jgi:peroxiredoxin
MMKKRIHSCTLIGVIALSAAWTGLRLHAQRSHRPVAGTIHRSNVDGFGHTRGIVQVDLMRQLIAGTARSTTSSLEPEKAAVHRVPSQNHPLLGRPAPELFLQDTRGKSWNLGTEVRNGPVVVVFYLGFTCMACVTHLTELDVALPRFRERGGRLLAISGDRPEFSLERMRKYGDFQIPLLSDPDHAVSLAYGVWKPLAGGEKDDGEALHGTFVIDRDGLVRWVYVGNRPFTDIEALLSELDSLRLPASPVSEARFETPRS